jgi:hypothetical protein
VAGWDEPYPRRIAVDLEFDYPDEALGRIVAGALEDMGLEVAEDGDAVLALELSGAPAGADYGDTGYCYTGARVRGTITLTAADRPALRFDLDGDYPTPFGVFTSACEEKRNPEDAPFDYAFEPEFKDAVVEFWGPGSVPYLTEILRDDLYLLRIRVETVQAVRLMDWSAIPPGDQYGFLESALWFCGRSTHMDDTGEIATYREAVARLFSEALDIDVEDLDSQAGISSAQAALDAHYPG